MFALKKILPAIFTLFITANAPASNFEIEKISAVSPAVKQYEPFILKIILKGTPANPFDPSEIDISASITSPDGKIMNVPAFFTGIDSLWEIRFTPSVKGDFAYSVNLKAGGLSYSSPAEKFTAAENKESNGFIRKNPNNAFFPVFDSGKSFVGLGHNIAWVTSDKVAVFERYFSDLSKNGGNLTRVWINNPWALPIEARELGKYDFDSLDKIDEVLKLAEKYNIYIILVLDSYGSLMKEQGDWNEGIWSNNPYCNVNGGPCKDADDFFTEPSAAFFYKNRIRHVISRYGYSPNVIAFELWNEMDAPPDWTNDMISYIKSINPHGQFITTSLGYPWGNNFNEHSIWELENVDIISRHMYGNMEKDLIGNLISVNKEFRDNYGKYILIGEFGLNAKKDDKMSDPDGNAVELHNSLWASIFSGSFAGSLNWWWQSYVRPKNLYTHYAALSKFLEEVDFSSKDVKFMDISPVEVNIPVLKNTSYSNISITPRETWGEKRYASFNILNNGDVTGGIVNHYLHGAFNEHLRIEPEFNVDFPAYGKLIISIGMVSQGAVIHIFIDGNEALKQEFPAGPGEGPWQRSLFRKDAGVYQCVYNTDISVNVPKGKHVIKLSNTGRDWIGIKKIIFTNYSSSRYADARALGLLAGDKILVWIQNKKFAWQKNNGVEYPEIKNASLKISGVKNGPYKIEWWDTFKGEACGSCAASAKDNILTIKIPVFSKDTACIIVQSG